MLDKLTPMTDNLMYLVELIGILQEYTLALTIAIKRHCKNGTTLDPPVQPPRGLTKAKGRRVQEEQLVHEK